VFWPAAAAEKTGLGYMVPSETSSHSSVFPSTGSVHMHYADPPSCMKHFNGSGLVHFIEF